VFKKVAPMFLVDDVNKAVEWYENVLGAKLEASFPENPPFKWASMLLDDIEIMFSQKKSAQEWYSKNVIVAERASNFIAYIYVKDTNILYNRIKDKVKVVMESIDQWYGIREFAIQDPFGFILIFAEILE